MKQILMSNLVEQIRGVSYKPTDLHDSLNSKSIALLRANNIVDGKIVFDDVVYVDRSKVSHSQILKKGDIFICASSGSKNLVGKAAQFDGSGEYTFGAFCKVVRPTNISADYIGMYFQSKTYRTIISNMAQGANINNIRNEDIDSLVVNCFDEEQQNKITDQLRKIFRIITLYKLQLQSLDDLIKARFVELFGMPGSYNNCWGIKHLGECCNINPKKTSDSRLTSGLEISFVPMPAVSENGNINTTEIKQYDEVKNGFTYFAENDVLFAKITPCMENGKGAVAVGLKNGIGFGSTEFHVLRPITDVSNPYWIYTLLSFDSFRTDAANNMTGSAGQRRVPASFLEKYKVSLPPIELQNQFADFVTQIDKSKL